MNSLPKNNEIAIIVFTQQGLNLAKKLSLKLNKSEIHVGSKRIKTQYIVFTNTGKHLRDLFDKGKTIIGICAVGILVRSLSSRIKGKKIDPPVIALSEDGKSIVPILGGHKGANVLAKFLANLTKGHPAITTASEVVFGISLDEPPKGWHLATPHLVKPVMAQLLSGKKIKLDASVGDASWLINSDLPFANESDLVIKITDKTLSKPDDALIYHPPVLALGVGCERGAELEELIDLVKKVFRESSLSPKAIACVVSIDVKMDEPAVFGLAQFLGVPMRFFSSTELAQESQRLINPSEKVYAAVGCYGVSEGSALRASGLTGQLVVEKTKSLRTTVAVARSNSAIDTGEFGRARGRLYIVGIGPGKKSWRTLEAENVINRCSHIVGYAFYIDLISDLVEGKICVKSEISQERERTAKALEFAAAGNEVALVCSGDAGIYALASLAFEIIEFESQGRWGQVSIEVIPGVSALQGAASRIGAPLGHDFCSISLSDLLTSWETIEKRISAAAEGDFVIAFYNPTSKKRIHHLEKAKEILLRFRPDHTPVIIARNIGRKDEKLSFTSLSELKSDMADMLTLVLVGSSQSRRISQGGKLKVYTPRGYFI